MWGTDCFVHQRLQQRGACAKNHPYAPRGVLVGYYRSSPARYVWLTQGEKLVTSERVTFGREEETLELVAEMRTVVDLL